MLTVKVYGLMAGPAGTGPMDVLYGSIELDDEGKVTVLPATKEHTNLLTSMITDKVYDRDDESEEPMRYAINEDPIGWMSTAHKFYCDPYLRATEPIEAE